MLDTAALDAAVDDAADDAFALLERLVAQPSTVGQESGALDVFAESMLALGFDVKDLDLPLAALEDPRGGVAQAIDGPRRQVVARGGGGSGRSLLLHGHIDVVPAESADLWTTPPFDPRRSGDRMYGRGAGDMKAGFAMGALAMGALMRVDPGAIRGPLGFLAAIEEECTGNGTLAAAQAGVVADAVVLLEPTGLDIMVGGVGVLWCDIDLLGTSGHAESSHLAANPIDLAQVMIAGLRSWAARLDAETHDPAFDDLTHPYNVNFGQLTAGDWPSSVPTRARLRARFGYPRAWSAEKAEHEVRAAVARIADEAGMPHAPSVRLSGFRARGYLVDPGHELVVAMSDAHEQVHGARPTPFVMGSTTDARFYVNDFNVPALCYGPTAYDIHGIDESVDLPSIVAGAKALARFMASWFAEERSS